MNQQTELTPVLRITAGIEFIQRGINDMDRAGVAAQALSEIDQCLAWLRSAFDDLPESIVTHEKARCDGCQYEDRTMMIYLGDLSIDEMEKRSGVDFPQELKDYMEPRRQQNASNIKKGMWHCFDIPFVLMCGDMETATEIHRHLKDSGPDFKEPLQISLSGA